MSAVERVIVGHLYPSYLNIYADRGNIAVLAARAGWRGVELEVRSIGPGDATPADVDLFYVGGGQDREQALIAPDLAERGPALAAAVAGWRRGCSPFAAGTSYSGASIAIERARSCRARASSRSIPSEASGG